MDRWRRRQNLLEGLGPRERGQGRAKNSTRCENAEAGRARHKETETIEKMTDITPKVSERDDGDRSVLDGGEEQLE